MFLTPQTYMPADPLHNLSTLSCEVFSSTWTSDRQKLNNCTWANIKRLQPEREKTPLAYRPQGSIQAHGPPTCTHAQIDAQTDMRVCIQPSLVSVVNSTAGTWRDSTLTCYTRPTQAGNQPPLKGHLAVTWGIGGSLLRGNAKVKVNWRTAAKGEGGW